LVVELEHLKIETRLIDEKFANTMGGVCDLEVIGVPSRLRLIRNVVTLVRIDETRDLNMEEKAARRKWKNAKTYI
jgi:hypothetical protein